MINSIEDASEWSVFYSAGHFLLLDHIKSVFPPVWTRWVFHMWGFWYLLLFHCLKSKRVSVCSQSTSYFRFLYELSRLITNFVQIFTLVLSHGILHLIFSVLKVPGVKKSLGVPEIPVAPAPPTTESKSSFLMFSAIKQAAEANAARQAASSALPAEPSKGADQRRSSSSSVLNQRLRSLEKQVKGRKKNKKRWFKF